MEKLQRFLESPAVLKFNRFTDAVRIFTYLFVAVVCFVVAIAGLCTELAEHLLLASKDCLVPWPAGELLDEFGAKLGYEPHNHRFRAAVSLGIFALGFYYVWIAEKVYRRRFWHR